MISDFLLIASVCGFALGLTACGIFLFSNKSQAFANRLLAVALFCLASIMIVTFLREWNMEYLAYIYRFPSPLYYLLLPCCYLYVRSKINNERGFRKWDWLHFLPALLHLVEMMPFYFTSYEYRKELTRQLPLEPEKLLELDEGLLPPNYHSVLRFIQGSIYIILMIRLLLATKRKNKGKMNMAQTQTYHWLVTLTSMMIVLAIPMIIYFIFPGANFAQGTRFLLMVISISFLVINLYLFFRPQILYGIQGMAVSNFNFDPVPEIVEDTPGEALTNGTGTSQSPALNVELYKSTLEKYVASEKPFLKQGYSITDLSAETGIPQHHLSALLNRVYELRFSDFLNRMRINYIRENFNKEDWHQLTLEGIARIAGFNSRTTFFNAIKKATGLTPSEFMLEIKYNHSKENGSSLEEAENKEEV